jgi:hypothetical protein
MSLLYICTNRLQRYTKKRAVPPLLPISYVKKDKNLLFSGALSSLGLKK